MTADRLSLRISPDNPDHHLWNNNGTWFLHYTVHRPDFTAARVRRSLNTKCIAQAREHRDRFFAHEGVAGARMPQPELS